MADTIDYGSLFPIDTNISDISSEIDISQIGSGDIGSGTVQNSSSNSDIPSWLKSLLGMGVTAYNISQGVPVSTSTQVGATTVKTGAATTNTMNYLLIIGVVVIAFLVLRRK
jgi:hypothetical protein